MSEPNSEAGNGASPFEIPEGIRRSREALKRDLPALLTDRRLHGKCVAYHGTDRIGIGRELDLLREAYRRGLRDDQFYLGVIEPNELVDEEEIDPREPATVPGISAP